MKVEKWGDELAIRLSAEVVELMGLKEGDEVDIRVSGTDTFDIKRTQGCERMLVRLRKYRGLLPKDFKFDRLEANARDFEKQD
jgi:antitoxin MazE